MTSYRTLLFGTLAVVAAAAPAAADCIHAQPLMAPVHKAPAPAQTTFLGELVGTIVSFENLVLHISL